MLAAMLSGCFSSKKNLVLDNIRKLNKVSSTNLSTLYTSSYWFILQYY